MKRWLPGLMMGLLIVGLAWTYHEAGFLAVRDYLSPDPEDPVPTLLLSQRRYRLLVLAEGELTGLKMTPVVTPRVRRGGVKIAWMREEGSLVQPGEVLVGSTVRKPNSPWRKIRIRSRPWGSTSTRRRPTRVPK